MKREHFLVLVRHRATGLHGTKAILLQQMQVHILQIKHISFTHEDTALPCPCSTGQWTQNYYTWPTVLGEPSA